MTDPLDLNAAIISKQALIQELLRALRDGNLRAEEIRNDLLSATIDLNRYLKLKGVIEEGARDG